MEFAILKDIVDEFAHHMVTRNARAKPAVTLFIAYDVDRETAAKVAAWAQSVRIFFAVRSVLVCLHMHFNIAARG